MSDDRAMDGEELDLLAGEYALGLLEGAELRDAEARLASDAAFRTAVGRWSSRLAPMLGEVEAVAPPAGAWTLIERAIAPAPAAGNVVRLRRSVNLWRAWSAAATAIAASLALVLVTRQVPAPAPVPEAPPRRPPMVAMVQSDGGATRLVATYDPDAGTLVVAPATLSAVSGHAHQLWLIPADGKPRPVAMIEPGRPMRMKMPDPMMPAMEGKVTVAVSVEPPGGSPTGLPTGPVIASGDFSAT
ncbi:MAG TPA: anti-sigma factor [Allosphingosinicella sp.]|jgi:anti-sigma-K factor RskA